jgi:hypothetical protein
MSWGILRYHGYGLYDKNTQQGNRRKAMAPICKFNGERDALLKQGYAENTSTEVILGQINATLNEGESAISKEMLAHRASWLKVRRSTEYRSLVSQQRRYRRDRTPVRRESPLKGDSYRQTPLPPLQSLHATHGGDWSPTLRHMAEDVVRLDTCLAERDCVFDWGRRNGVLKQDLAAVNDLRRQLKLPIFQVL